MILPAEIKTRNKIRDAKIISLFLNDNLTTYEIGQQFGITHQRISTILYKNRELLTYDKQYEKSKRINALKRMAKQHEGVLGKKSAIDIHEQLRKEMEGDKPLIDNSIHSQTFVYLDDKAKQEANAKADNRIAPELSSK